MKSRFFYKYCPACKASNQFYLSPADDKFACMGVPTGPKGCGKRYTNEELDTAFLNVSKDVPKIDPLAPNTPLVNEKTYEALTKKTTAKYDLSSVSKAFKEALAPATTAIHEEFLRNRANRVEAEGRKLTLPTDSEARKGYPMLSGVLKYFAAALAGVARTSKIGNDKHNPGQPLHHARGKSMDHGDCIVRHLMDIEDLLAARERGDTTASDAEILTEAGSLCWRALAYSQELHEKLGAAPLAPGAK